MSPKVRYALSVLAVSAVLFAVWPLVVPKGASLLSSLASDIRALFMAPPVMARPDRPVLQVLIPLLAVILCARGLPLARRSLFCVVALASYAVGEVSAGVLDLPSIYLNDSAERTLGQSALLVAYVTFQFAFTFGVLIAFVKGNVRSLWESKSPGRFPACPICGARKTDLAAHVAAVHGESALRSPKVRRLLEKRAA